MTSLLRSAFASLIIASAGIVSAGSAQAQGIPVIDVANLNQTIVQVTHDITAIKNQVQQITQLQTQLNSINATSVTCSTARR
jgi:type IV secretion system protein VirB5